VEQAKKKIAPAEYATLLECVELGNIYLKEVRSTLHRHEIGNRPEFQFKEDYQVIEHNDNHALIEVAYTVKTRNGRSNIATIQAKYHVRLTTSKLIPSEFFHLYSQYSLPLQTFPYYRELVDSHFTKMGLPRLLLPLRKFLVRG